MAGVLLGPGPLTKSVAAPYDATATYGVGDHCSKDGKIYICVSAITTAEAWTDAHWERVMVEEEIEDTKKGLAYVEEGTTASQNIAAGSYVWWQGQMCVAASAIAVGDTLSSTNLTVKSTGGLNDLNSNITANSIGKLWTKVVEFTTDGGGDYGTAISIPATAKEIGFAAGGAGMFIAAMSYANFKATATGWQAGNWFVGKWNINVQKGSNTSITRIAIRQPDGTTVGDAASKKFSFWYR